MELISPFTPMKLLAHRDKIAAMLSGGFVYPVSVEFDASNMCPHDCPFCSFGTSQSHGYRQQNWVQFPTERALSLMEELAACGVKAVTFTGGGEPLVHKSIAAIMEKAASVGLEFGVVTNGFALKGAAQDVIAKHAKFVRVSLDAGTAETHRYTHGTATDQFHAIIANIAATRAKSPTLTIGASFCMMEQNYKELYAAAKLLKDVGASYIECRPTYPTDWRGDGWGHALTSIEEARTEILHARHHLDGDGFRVIGMVDRFDALTAPKKEFSQCRTGALTTVIGADGRIWWCCVQRGQEFFNTASVLHQPFSEAWREAMDKRMSERIDLATCPRCRYDSLNFVLSEAIEKDGCHANFF
jgi:MoaA/NifB/PqqE/SkfB family radical SAM enzyme